MQVQKAIEIFLQKNNLTKTLQSFRRQSRKLSNPNQNPHKGLHSQLLGIQKFTLNRSNANELREHFQKTDEKVLRRTIHKIKKNRSQLVREREGADVQKLVHLPFFKRLLEKENFQANQKQAVEESFSELRESRSFINTLEESRFYENEWEGQDDIGYELYECFSNELERNSAELAKLKQTQKNSIRHAEFPTEYYQRHHQKISRISSNLKDKKKTKLPPKAVFPREDHQTVYPLEVNGVAYDSYDLKIIYDREKTGFEQERQITIVINQVLAGRYQVIAVLGQAKFSKAIQVKDLTNNKHYCIKIIENNKDYFDQSIDQIKILRYVSANCNPEESRILNFYDFFYHKEHLMLVTELLKDNLQDAYKMHPDQFSLKALQSYSRQILLALDKLHSLHIIHTDLKPENILIQSYSKQELKVIDFGSSIFFHDELKYYVQTKDYRAPEVILKCEYDEKIDIWSFGCTLAFLFTGQNLFTSPTTVGILAKMQGLRGPWPSWMIERGKDSHKYFTNNLILYETGHEEMEGSKGILKDSHGKVRMYLPKYTNLKARLGANNKLFVDFISKCLKLDPSVRLSAKQALKHPFLAENID